MSVTKIPRGAYYEFHVGRGHIGPKRSRAADREIVWEVDEDGRVCLVCPCCNNIQIVPNHLISPGGYIQCMYCAYCHSDHAYLLKDWKGGSCSRN